YEIARLKASREKLVTAVDMQCEVMAQQEVFEQEGGNKDEDKGGSKKEAPKEGGLRLGEKDHRT
ncbi:hypothetical protein FOZ63_001246, partial [Perkinsus olseni]